MRDRVGVLCDVHLSRRLVGAKSFNDCSIFSYFEEKGLKHSV